MITCLIAAAVAGAVYGFLSALLFSLLVTRPFVRSRKNIRDIQGRASARVIHLVISLLGFAIVMVVVQRTASQEMTEAAMASFAILAVVAYIAFGWLAGRKANP